MKIAITRNGSTIYYENLEPEQKVDEEVIGYTTPPMLSHFQEAIKNLSSDQYLLLAADADDFLWPCLWLPGDEADKITQATLAIKSTMAFIDKNAAIPTFGTKQMETAPQQKITGERELTKEEIDLINEAKALAEQCGAFIEKLKERRLDLDQRWISIGATDLQKGWMSVIRGIEQPTTF